MTPKSLEYPRMLFNHRGLSDRMWFRVWKIREWKKRFLVRTKSKRKRKFKVYSKLMMIWIAMIVMTGFKLQRRRLEWKHWRTWGTRSVRIFQRNCRKKNFWNKNWQKPKRDERLELKENSSLKSLEEPLLDRPKRKWLPSCFNLSKRESRINCKTSFMTLTII